MINDDETKETSYESQQESQTAAQVSAESSIADMRSHSPHDHNNDGEETAGQKTGEPACGSQETVAGANQERHGYKEAAEKQDKAQSTLVDMGSVIVRSNGNDKEIIQQKHNPQEPLVQTVERPAVSAKKVEANRRNACKSTGPRTVVGKKTVAHNALKHGFFSKYLFIQNPVGGEDPAEFHVLYGKLREYYQPVGILEQLRVEEIAVCYWKLRRLIRSESGYIGRGLVEYRYNIQRSRKIYEELGTERQTSPETDTMTDHLWLPSREPADKLLRYEAMINKHLSRAIAELERLQARRRSSEGCGPESEQRPGG